MSVIADVVRTLGGPRVVPARSAEELRDLVRAGLPYASLSAVASGLSLDGAAIVSILRIPARTLARRKRERRLSPDESDRLFRLGRVVTLAEDVLGSREKANLWLHAANRALGGLPPLSQLDTDLGAERVEDVLLRLAHGVVG
ncbi:MAG: antitoxin Xre/MbcA/ParS toxin-binding domain-containing protein [Thermoanaerobaculia bacterium]